MKEIGDAGDDFGVAQHADLDAMGWKVVLEVPEGVLKKGRRDGFEGGDAQGGLDGKRGNRRGGEDAMRLKHL